MAREARMDFLPAQCCVYGARCVTAFGRLAFDLWHVIKSARFATRLEAKVDATRALIFQKPLNTFYCVCLLILFRAPIELPSRELRNAIARPRATRWHVGDVRKLLLNTRGPEVLLRETCDLWRDICCDLRNLIGQGSVDISERLALNNHFDSRRAFGHRAAL